VFFADDVCGAAITIAGYRKMLNRRQLVPLRRDGSRPGTAASALGPLPALAHYCAIGILLVVSSIFQASHAARKMTTPMTIRPLFRRNMPGTSCMAAVTPQRFAPDATAEAWSSRLVALGRTCRL
jgi:hypothetical protein